MQLETYLLIASVVGNAVIGYFAYKGNKPKVEAEAESVRITNLDRLWDQVQEMGVAYFRLTNEHAALSASVQRIQEKHADEIKQLKQQLDAERRARQTLERQLNTEREARIRLEGELVKRDERIQELEKQVNEGTNKESNNVQ